MNLTEGIVVVLLSIWLILSIVHRCNSPREETKSEVYKRGYNEGYGDGLDTLCKEIVRAAKNDSIMELTTVTDQNKEWIGKDTFHVFLTNKTKITNGKRIPPSTRIERSRPPLKSIALDGTQNAQSKYFPSLIGRGGFIWLHTIRYSGRELKIPTK